MGWVGVKSSLSSSMIHHIWYIKAIWTEPLLLISICPEAMKLCVYHHLIINITNKVIIVINIITNKNITMDKAVLIYNGKAIYNGSSAVYLHRGPIMSGYISAEKLRHICRCFQIQIVFLTEKMYFFRKNCIFAFLHFFRCGRSRRQRTHDWEWRWVRWNIWIFFTYFSLKAYDYYRYLMSQWNIWILIRYLILSYSK